MFHKALLGVAAAALLLPVAAMAQGEENQLIVTGANSVEQRSVIVSLSDLDLRSDHAVRIADVRLRGAAAEVCDDSGLVDLHQRRSFDMCYKPAVSAAREDLNAIVAAKRA